MITSYTEGNVTWFSCGDRHGAIFLEFVFAYWGPGAAEPPPVETEAALMLWLAGC